MESEKFCLRWNDFKLSISESFQNLREEKDFFDVTLACEDNQIQAHKVILSACSPFFRNILRRNPHPHPLLYLKDVKYTELLSVINFMYLGEVSVAQDELNSFLNVAEELRVKGLTQTTQEYSTSNNKTKKEHGGRRENNSKRSSELPFHNSRNNARPASSNIKQHSQYRNQQEEDVYEASPLIKSEPREPAQQAPSVRSDRDQTQARYQQQVEEEHELVQEQIYDEENGGNVEQGTVAIDESYTDDAVYDYQYDDPSYGATAETNTYYEENSGVSKDIDSLILSKMTRNEAGEWQCNECFRTSNRKTNIMEHIEASHVESSGYNCDICYKVFKTKHSLRTHKNVKHKEYKHVQQ